MKYVNLIYTNIIIYKHPQTRKERKKKKLLTMGLGGRLPKTRDPISDSFFWLVISVRAGRFLANWGFDIVIFLMEFSDADGSLLADDDE